MALTNLEFYAIQPKEATNLITNPSIEVDTTGYDKANGTIARVLSQQRRGVASLELTPTSGATSQVYYVLTLANTTSYSFSVDVLDVIGQTMTLAVGDSSVGTIAAGTSWTGNGRWKRKYITFTTTSAPPYYLIVQRSSIASTAKIYLDGWQCELGALSSYLDGDMRGFVRGQTDYYWNGTPHASTSYRSGQTRSGGTEVRLRDYIKIMAVLGLGMSPVINNALPNIRGGAFYQNSVFDSRTITLGGAIIGSTPGAIMTNRKALLAAVNPRQTQTEQPMILRIKGLDGAGLEMAETVDAVVQYSGGMEGNWEGAGLERASMQFQQFLPYLSNEAEVGTALATFQTVTNTNYIAYRSKSGAWSALTTGTNGAVRSIAIAKDGSVYVGGDFTSAGGVANTSRIAKWDGTAWSALGTGAADGFVYSVKIAADGTTLYAAGGFSGMGGVANTLNIAKWDGANWTPLTTGTNATVSTLALGLDGNLFVGGAFTSAGGVANTVYIAKWNGTAWSALGAGLDSNCSALDVGQDGTLYAGGSFANAGGSAAAKIAKWNGTAWSTMGTGANNSVYTITTGPDGSVYAGGNFTAMGGVTNTAYIARWNGSSWSPLGTGMNATITKMKFGSDGNLYAGGLFTVAGGVTLLENFATWNGSSWTYPDIDLPGSSSVTSIAFDISGGMYAGYITSGSSNTSIVQSITNANAYPVYPKITFTGSGTIYQIRNVTTGKTIYFNYTMLAGETAVLDLDPNNLKFTSSFRGNVINTILPGSNLDFQLVTGINSISTLFGGSTAPNMVWKPLYSNYDGALY